MGEVQQMEGPVPAVANYIQVSSDTNPYVYYRSADRLFTGTQQQAAFEEIIISGLGSATKTAVGAAAILSRDRNARITKVTTELFESDKLKRKLPKITIVLAKQSVNETSDNR